MVKYSFTLLARYGSSLGVTPNITCSLYFNSATIRSWEKFSTFLWVELKVFTSLYSK